MELVVEALEDEEAAAVVENCLLVEGMVMNSILILPIKSNRVYELEHLGTTAVLHIILSVI